MFAMIMTLNDVDCILGAQVFWRERERETDEEGGRMEKKDRGREKHRDERHLINTVTVQQAFNSVVKNVLRNLCSSKR